MKLDFLRTVTAIVDQGSLVAAGEALGLSHSAISLRVKALEDELGFLIFDREARPLRLTPLGAELLVQARELEQLTHRIRDIGQGDRLSGLLRLGAVPTTLALLVPPALAALRQRHPQLELHVKSGLSGELALALRQGEIDAALLSEPALPIEGMTSTAIAVEELVLIANPATARTEENWRAILRREPFIWFSRKTWAGQQIERFLLQARIAVRGQMEVDSLEAIAAMVRHGLGVAIVPWRHGEDRGDQRIRRFGLDDPELVRRLVLMRRAPAARSLLTDALVDALRQAAAGDADNAS